MKAFRLVLTYQRDFGNDDWRPAKKAFIRPGETLEGTCTAFLDDFATFNPATRNAKITDAKLLEGAFTSPALPRAIVPTTA